MKLPSFPSVIAKAFSLGDGAPRSESKIAMIAGGNHTLFSESL